jgi:hypothetical protein
MNGAVSTDTMDAAGTNEMRIGMRPIDESNPTSDGAVRTAATFARE